MKKIAALCFLAVMGLQLTACSVGADKNAWIEEDKAKIGTTLDCGQFVVDGTVYSFPADVADWTNNGWHISNNYENKDSFLLESSVFSNEFELFNDENKDEYVGMCAINLGAEPAKIEESAIDMLKISTSQNDRDPKLVLPGGITYNSTKEDIIAAYGTPVEEDEDGLLLYYTYTGKDDLEVIVELRVFGDTLNRVVYSLSEDNWGSIKNEDECSQFIDDALKTSFYCDYARYVENKFDTEENALMLYETEVEYYTQGLMYYLDIDYDTADDATLEGFREATKQIFKKFKWDAPVVNLTGDTWGEVELTMYPTDFLDIILEDAQQVADTAETEEDYNAGMLAVVTSKIDSISYREPVIKTYDIDIDDGVITTEDWDEIDDILMDFSE